MYKNRTCFIQFGFCMFLCLTWAMLDLSVKQSAVAAGNNTMQGKRVVINDPRPVAKAMDVLEQEYGWIITYEDPRYVNEDDVIDVTSQVRRSRGKEGKREPSRVIIPKGGQMDIYLPLRSDSMNPDSAELLILTILNAATAKRIPGSFVLTHSDGVFHVVPGAVKDRSGRSSPHVSVLDVTIAVPNCEGTVMEVLEKTCAAVTTSTQMRVVLGNVPIGIFTKKRVGNEVMNKTARETLGRIFSSIGGRFSWRLFYDPGLQWYVLNVHLVETAGKRGTPE